MERDTLAALEFWALWCIACFWTPIGILIWWAVAR